jgi:hypothetical protein
MGITVLELSRYLALNAMPQEMKRYETPPASISNALGLLLNRGYLYLYT